MREYCVLSQLLRMVILKDVPMQFPTNMGIGWPPIWHLPYCFVLVWCFALLGLELREVAWQWGTVAPFHVGYFWGKSISLHPAQARPWPSNGMGKTGTLHHVQSLVEMEVSWIFCPSWPQSAILPISASQVTRITDLNHWTWLSACFWDRISGTFLPG
jgi:hypothetical protein